MAKVEDIKQILVKYKNNDPTKDRILEVTNNNGTPTDVPLDVNQWYEFHVEANAVATKRDFHYVQRNDPNGADGIYFHRFKDNQVAIDFKEVAAKGGGTVWALEFIGVGDIRAGRAHSLSGKFHMLDEPQYLKLIKKGNGGNIPNEYAYACKFEKTFKP